MFIIIINLSVSVARVEWEWGLPPLPTVGPGLHLLLREEDPAGGAWEGLHVLQACKDQMSDPLVRLSFLSERTQRGDLCFLASVPKLIHSVLSAVDKTCLKLHPEWWHMFILPGLWMSDTKAEQDLTIIRGLFANFWSDLVLISQRSSLIAIKPKCWLALTLLLC